LTFTALVAGTIVCLCNHQVNLHLRTSSTQLQQQQHHQESDLQQSITNTKSLFVPKSTGQLWGGVSSTKRSPLKKLQTPYQKSAVASTPVDKVTALASESTDSSSSSSSCLKLAGIIVVVQSPSTVSKQPGDIVKLPSKVSTNLSVYGRDTVNVFSHGSSIFYVTILINNPNSY
jgi:hypothetical protein